MHLSYNTFFISSSGLSFLPTNTVQSSEKPMHHQFAFESTNPVVEEWAFELFKDCALVWRSQGTSLFCRNTFGSWSFFSNLILSLIAFVAFVAFPSLERRCSHHSSLLHIFNVSFPCVQTLYGFLFYSFCKNIKYHEHLKNLQTGKTDQWQAHSSCFVIEQVNTQPQTLRSRLDNIAGHCT